MQKLLVLSAALLGVGCTEFLENPDGGSADLNARLEGNVTVFQGAGQSLRTPNPRSLKLAKQVMNTKAAALSPSAIRTADLAKKNELQRFGPIRVGALRGVSQPSTIRPGEVIVRFNSEFDAKTAVSMLQLEGYTVKHGGFASNFLHLALVTRADGGSLTETQTIEVTDALGKKKGVRFAELNRVRHALAVPNDSLYPAMWHLPPINLPAAWDLEKGTTAQVTVAVVDTGIVSHPDLNQRVISGYDMVSDTANAGDGNGRDADPTDTGGDLPQNQSSWHGTHVAGTIGANTDNGSGVAGINWNARILPVRVLGKQGGTDFDIIAGVNWAAGLNVPGVPANANPASVINMSLGGPGEATQAAQDVIDQVNARNVIVVVAAGNDDVEASTFNPCNQQNVICVGATRLNGKRASYSNYGSRVDLMAPGGEVAEDLNGDGYADGVLSTLKGEDGQPTYAFENGTSMAAPHIAGVVSLMKARNANLTYTQARQYLVETASTASRCSEGCGAGLVNVQAALLRVTGAAVPTGPAKLSVNTSGLFFTPASTQQEVSISNVGGAALNVTITPAGTEAARVTVMGGNTRNLGPGETSSVSVSANLQGLDAASTASAVLNITSNGGSGTVAVKLRNANAGGPDVAVAAIYEDSDGEWQVHEAIGAKASNGFSFSLPVAPGRYFLFGVQDANNNGDYDDGEPVGFYPNDDNPRELTVDRNGVLRGLNFAVSPPGNVTGDESSFIGAACSDDPACGGDGAYCVTGFPGGYCAALCDTDPCPIGATCIAGQTASVCLSACSGPRAGRSSCSSGYVCEDDGSGGGVCIPGCTTDADCSPQTCNVGSGYCQ
ncbi:MAG: S8 family serine peptidase [Archangium sp.]